MRGTEDFEHVYVEYHCSAGMHGARIYFLLLCSQKLTDIPVSFWMRGFSENGSEMQAAQLFQKTCFPLNYLPEDLANDYCNVTDAFAYSRPALKPNARSVDLWRFSIQYQLLNVLVDDKGTSDLTYGFLPEQTLSILIMTCTLRKVPENRSNPLILRQ